MENFHWYKYIIKYILYNIIILHEYVMWYHMTYIYLSLRIVSLFFSFSSNFDALQRRKRGKLEEMETKKIILISVVTRCCTANVPLFEISIISGRYGKAENIWLVVKKETCLLRGEISRIFAGWKWRENRRHSFEMQSKWATRQLTNRKTRARYRINFAISFSDNNRRRYLWNINSLVQVTSKFRFRCFYWS